MRTRAAILIFLLGTVFFLGASLTAAAVRSVWAVNDGEKIARDDLNNPNKPTNSAWDGHKIKIFGARNEIIAFQLIIETDSKGIDHLTVALPVLSQKGGKARINYTPPALDPTTGAGSLFLSQRKAELTKL